MLEEMLAPFGEEQKIRLSHAILGMLGLVVAFLLSLCTLAYQAGAKLQRIDDSVAAIQRQQERESQEMDKVKALLWTPTIRTVRASK